MDVRSRVEQVRAAMEPLGPDDELNKQSGVPMFIAYCVIAVLDSVMLTFSGILKLQLNPQVVQTIHELIGVPLNMLPVLAACEFAGAIGLLAGIRWKRLGVAAAIGLVIYFVGAIMSHVRVGDFAGIGGAVLMLVIAVTVLLPETQRTTAETCSLLSGTARSPSTAGWLTSTSP